MPSSESLDVQKLVRKKRKKLTHQRFFNQIAFFPVVGKSIARTPVYSLLKLTKYEQKKVIAESVIYTKYMR